MSYADKKFNPWRIKNGTRVLASEAMWKKPVNWNTKNIRCSECGDWHSDECDYTHCDCGASIDENCFPDRQRVFCASMADVFEDWEGVVKHSNGRDMLVSYGDGGEHWAFEGQSSYPGGKDWCDMTLNDVRRRLFDLIDATPNLDWLVLTKRPENIHKMIERCHPVHTRADFKIGQQYRSNLWLGVSIANQEDANRNIPLLLQCRDLAPVLFVSYEPAVGPVHDHHLAGFPGDPSMADGWCWGDVDWVIVGGESGPNARPFDVAWARSTVQQCAAAGVRCFVKQMGANVLIADDTHPHPSHWSGMRASPEGCPPNQSRVIFKAKKGDDPLEWPEDLRVRQFPVVKQ